MNSRKLLVAMSTTILVVGMMAGAMGTVLAVHDAGVFQMDGNAQTSVQSDPTATEDWDLICKASTATCTFRSTVTPPSGSTAATAASHVADGTGATIFTTGGSKDPEDVSSWRYKDGSVPDKDNLLHSFAARYSVPASAECPTTGGAATCELLYFGSDRFDNSGDAQQGFWFFQKKVQLGANGRFVNALGQPATHTNGDLLIVSDFSNGGTVSTINVYKWNNGALSFIAGGDDAKCDPALDTDPFCGIVNPANGTIAPWTYTDKSGNGTYLQGELYEAGLNLSDPSINLGGECFSSFLSETRSSTSTTATLKDFVLGQFGVCGATMGTTPTGGGEIGANGQKTVSDSATINVTGGATPPAPTGNVLFYLCGPSTTSISTCSAETGTLKATVGLAGATKSGNAYTINSGDSTVASAGYYCWFSTWAGDDNYPEGASHAGADECFQVTPRQPALHTNVSNAGPVVPGTTVKDTVTFDTAPATPSNGAFGTVTFNVYGPFATTTATCTGTPTTSTATIVAGQAAYDSANFSPTAPGYYYWKASYAPGTGDVNNVARVGVCGESNEAFQVQQFQPGLTTAQTWTVKDSSTVTVSGGGALAGTVHFALFKNNTCSGTAFYTEDVALVDGGTIGSETVSTTPVTFTASQSVLYWRVSYTSTNTSHADVAATCTENSVLTVTN